MSHLPPQQYAPPAPLPGEPPTESQRGVYSVATAARTGQVITFGLAQGVLLIAAVLTYFAVGNDPQAAPGQPNPGPVVADDGLLGSPDLVMLAIGLSFAALSFLAALWLPSLSRQRAIKRYQAAQESLPLPLQANDELPPAARKLVQSRMTATLMSQALFEGAAIANALLLLISPHLLHLIPVAIGVFGIVAQVPTAAKLLDWLESVRRS